MLPPNISPQVEIDLRDHALSAWPEECCGVVRDGAYVPLDNRAPDRLNGFVLPADAMIGASAVLHSHVAQRHTPWPTKTDMQGQMSSALPWAIVTTDGETAGGVVWLGEQVLDEPLLGRPFEPGVRDCYALARAWWWQTRRLKLADIARSDRWWETEDLWPLLINEAGFVEVRKDDVRSGDLVLMQVRADVTNHCGVVLEGGLLLHHLGGRLSRREPLGPWGGFVTHVLRHG